MAIEFARVKIHTRTRGESSVGAAAYRAGIKITDERTNKVYDFRKRKDVVYSDIILPDSGNLDFSSRETLWNEVEASEKRCDSQVAKEVILALPRELSLEENIELTKRFIYFHYVQHGIVADINIHDKGDGNPHAHVLMTTRRLETSGLSRYKARDLNPSFSNGKITEQDFVSKKWRSFQNDFFIENDINLKVDLNHLIPESHQGRIRGEVSYLEQKNEEIKGLRNEIALNNIDSFINYLSFKSSIFTQDEVEKLLFKSVLAHDSCDFKFLIDQVMAHSDIVELGANINGVKCFTTRQHYIAETRLFSLVDKIESNNIHKISKDISKELSPFGLKEEQQEAIKHVVSGGGISAVVGNPGAGKSYMLKALKAIYDKRGYKVIGTSVSDKVTKALNDETGIESYTLSSLNYRLEKGYLNLTSDTVVIVDEAGMAEFLHYASLLEYVKKSNAKIVLSGDPKQLKSIGKGDLFKAIIERVGCYLMEDIQRQKDLGDREASRALCKGNVDLALEHYSNKGGFVYDETENDVINSITKNWVSDVKESGLSGTVMLAFTRKSVDELNDSSRNELIKNQVINGDQYCECTITRNFENKFNDAENKLEKELFKLDDKDSKQIDVDIKISVGDRVIFKKKDKKLDIINGEIGTVIDFDSKSFTVKTDNSNKTITVPRSYKYFDYAYAMTLHKAQGVTLTNAHVYVDSIRWNKYLSLVAMTRHREKLLIYASKSIHSSKEVLLRSLKRAHIKDNLIDWPLSFAIRMGFDPDAMLGKAVNKIAGIKHKIQNQWKYLTNYESYLKDKEWAVSLKEKQALRSEAKHIANYLEYQRQVAKYHKRISSYPSFKDAPQALQKNMYESGLMRDRAGFNLITYHRDVLENENFAHVDISKVERASQRYQDYCFVKSYLKSNTENKELGDANIKRFAELDLKSNFMHIKQISAAQNLQSQNVYSEMLDTQRKARKALLVKLEEEHPLLKEFNQVAADRGKQKGYRAELMDKKLKELSSELRKNKQLVKVLKSSHPLTFNLLKQQLQLDLGKDRNKDIER